MRKIITEAKPTEVLSRNLMGNEIVTYRSKNSENYCVLSKLTSKTIFEKARGNTAGKNMYGFIALNGSSNEPRFASETWQGAIELASQSRDLYTFPNMKEMLLAMVNNKF